VFIIIIINSYIQWILSYVVSWPNCSPASSVQFTRMEGHQHRKILAVYSTELFSTNISFVYSYLPG